MQPLWPPLCSSLLPAEPGVKGEDCLTTPSTLEDQSEDSAPRLGVTWPRAPSPRERKETQMLSQDPPALGIRWGTLQRSVILPRLWSRLLPALGRKDSWEEDSSEEWQEGNQLFRLEGGVMRHGHGGSSVTRRRRGLVVVHRGRASGIRIVIRNAETGRGDWGQSRTYSNRRNPWERNWCLWRMETGGSLGGLLTIQRKLPETQKSTR